jgi:multidrug efflux pump subunit AcrA (membrane-fusion protein)
MTANADLTTAEKKEVLLVPNEAINVDRQAGTYSVNLVLGETVQQVEVMVGMHDDRHSQIISGLNPGDELLVDNAIPTLFDDVEPGGGMFGGGLAHD